MESINTYGVVGILVLLILRDVFAFVQTRRNGKKKSCHFHERWGGNIEELHEWHKPDAETGRFRWYERDDEIIQSVVKIGEDIVHEIRELRKAYTKERALEPLQSLPQQALGGVVILSCPLDPKARVPDLLCGIKRRPLVLYRPRHPIHQLHSHPLSPPHPSPEHHHTAAPRPPRYIHDSQSP